MSVVATRIDQLARELEQRKNANQRPVLVLGSRAGGLFRSPYFYETMAAYSMRDFASLTLRDQFSACYHTLSMGFIQRSDIQVIVREALEELNSTVADACLATLMQQELFRFVFTNNVDDMLENALVAQGMKEQQHFLVFYPGRLITEILFPSKPLACRLIKLCGDERQFAHDIARGRFQEVGSQFMNGLLERLQTHTREALIVGIDLDWDAGIIAALPPQIKTVWLVSEDEAVKDFVHAHYPHMEQIKYIIEANEAYTRFFFDLSWHINRGIPKRYEEPMYLSNQLNTIREEARLQRKEFTEELRQLRNEFAENFRLLHKELAYLREQLSHDKKNEEELE